MDQGRLNSFVRNMDSPVAHAPGTRKNFVWAFIGANGTGKTVTSLQLARAWRKYNPRRRIIAFDPQGVLERELLDASCGDILIPRGLKNWAKILTKEIAPHQYQYTNYLLFIDDYRMLCTDDKTDSGLLDLLALRRFINCDVIVSTHNPSLILERLSYYVTNYSIYFTSAAEGGFDKRTANYANCEKACRIVRQYVIQHGMGSYPKFPYALVTDKAKDIRFHNMDKKKTMEIIEKM